MNMAVQLRRQATKKTLVQPQGNKSVDDEKNSKGPSLWLELTLVCSRRTDINTYNLLRHRVIDLSPTVPTLLFICVAAHESGWLNKSLRIFLLIASILRSRWIITISQKSNKNSLLFLRKSVSHCYEIFLNFFICVSERIAVVDFQPSVLNQ